VAVSYTEALLGPGSISADFDYTDDLAALLVDYATLLFRRNGELIASGVILSPGLSVDGITVTGRSLDWHMGQEGDGPLIRERTYLSGVSLLTNGDFHLWGHVGNDPANPVPTHVAAEFWTLDQATNWEIRPGPSGGPGTAVVAFAPFANDPLASADTVTVKPAQVYRLAADVTRSAGSGLLGRLRLRLALTGRFATPDLGSPYAAWGPSTGAGITLTTDPSGVVPGPCFEIHAPIPNRAPNGEFDDGVGLNGWVQGSGAWFPITDGTAWSPPTYAMTDTSVIVAGTKILESSADGGVTAPAAPQHAVPGERWEIRLVIRPHAGSGADGEAWGRILLFNGATLVGYMQTSGHIRAEAPGWTIERQQFDIPDGVDGFTFAAAVAHTAGQWDFDSGTAIRVRGNIDTREGPAIPVVSGRGYRWEVPLRIDLPASGLVDGTVQLRVRCTGADRPDVVLQGTTLQTTKAGKQFASYLFVPPSGYDTAYPQIYTADLSKSTYVGQGTIRDADPSTRDLDIVSPMTGTDLHLTGDLAIPDGAETAHVEVVAEDSAVGWSTTRVALTRIDQAPTTVADVLRQLLVHPTTGRALFDAGVVDAPGYLKHDWPILNLNNRQAWVQLCRTGLARQLLEWRLRPEGTMDVGPAESVFTDRTDFVLTRHDFRLLSKLRRTRSVETRVNDVLVVGAEKVTGTGSKTQVKGEVVNSSLGVDHRGNPIIRARVVSDTSINQGQWADERASYEAVHDADPKLTLHISVSDWLSLSRFVTGDWLYFFDEESGLVDLTREMRDADGERAWPVRLRVQTASYKLGPGPFTVSVLQPDGSEYEIPDELVRWSDSTGAEFDVGDPRPEFALDSAGGASGDQFHAFWTSTHHQ
jgi:hypothetical protein